MRGTSHVSHIVWLGCLDRRTNNLSTGEWIMLSTGARIMLLIEEGIILSIEFHGEHINPGLTGEQIILLHRRANHPVPQELESSCSTRERIIISQCAPTRGGWVTLWSYVAPVGTTSPQSSQSSMYVTCRTLVQGFLSDSKSFGKITY